jgi:hypothetical protein
MSADDDTTADDVALWVRDTIGAAGLEDAATESRILQLADGGRGEEAVKLLEAAARPGGTKEMFWSLMAETAGALGLDERVAEYERRHEENLEYPPEWPFSVFDDIVATVRSSRSVPDGFAGIVDLCAEQFPHEDWSQFRTLELEPDIARLKQWLASVLVADPPGPDARVLWFGLSNPIRDDKPTADLAVCGFAADPERAGPVTWEPSSSEAGSETLAQIYALAYPDEERAGADDALGGVGDGESLGNDAEYPLCLTYAGLVVRTLATELGRELLLAQAAERALSFGFDSGEAIPLGTITQDGLRLHDA